MKALKMLIAASILLLSPLAFAASTEQVNSQALAILIQNSSKLTSEDGQAVPNLLAGALVTSADTHNKISNSCNYDKGDQVFNCSLVITNADDKLEGRTESSTVIQYQLETDASGNPAKEMFFLTVQVQQAG